MSYRPTTEPKDDESRTNGNKLDPSKKKNTKPVEPGEGNSPENEDVENERELHARFDDLARSYTSRQKTKENLNREIIDLRLERFDSGFPNSKIKQKIENSYQETLFCMPSLSKNAETSFKKYVVESTFYKNNLNIVKELEKPLLGLVASVYTPTKILKLAFGGYFLALHEPVLYRGITFNWAEFQLNRTEGSVYQHMRKCMELESDLILHHYVKSFKKLRRQSLKSK